MSYANESIWSFPLSRPGVDLWSWRAGMDNFAWLLVRNDGHAVAVDLPDGPGLLTLLKRHGLTLDSVWFTHTHHDHVVGVEEVFATTGCAGRLPAGAHLPVSGVREVADGETFADAGYEVEAMDTSGHSPLDFSFVLRAEGICFCGDTVFDGGCGRMFAGTAERFWRSQCRMRDLPESLWLCGGHDYAADNYAFALSRCPEDPVLRARMDAVSAAEKKGGFRFPVTVGDQREGNLFWRADDPATLRAAGLRGVAPVEAFAALREAKDRF